MMDDKDIAIMLELIADPRSSNKSIAKKMEISEATVSRRIKSLKDQSIIKEVQIRYDRTKIGLKMINLILLPEDPWNATSLLLRLFFKNHAYTAFQSRIFGKQNGLFVQLNIPPHSEEYVTDLINQLKEYKLVKEVVFNEPQKHSSFIYPIDPSKYNMTSRQFVFSYDKIREHIRKEYVNLQLKTENLNREFLDKDNLRLLWQFHNNADRSLAKIGNNIDMTKQEVSKRKIKLNLDEWRYDLRYDREQFGVFNQALFLLNNNGKALAALNAVLTNHFPFRAQIIPCGDILILRIDLPAVDVMQFTDILYERFSRIDLYLLGRNPKDYPPWYENLEDGKWLHDSDRITHTFNSSFTNQLSVQKFLEKYGSWSLEELNSEFEKGN